MQIYKKKKKKRFQVGELYWRNQNREEEGEVLYNLNIYSLLLRFKSRTN